MSWRQHYVTWGHSSSLSESVVQNPRNQEKKGAFYSQDGLSNHHENWESSEVIRLRVRKVNSLTESRQQLMGWYYLGRVVSPGEIIFPHTKIFDSRQIICSLSKYPSSLLCRITFRVIQRLTHNESSALKTKTSQQPSIQDKKNFQNTSCF